MKTKNKKTRVMKIPRHPLDSLCDECGNEKKHFDYQTWYATRRGENGMRVLCEWCHEGEPGYIAEEE